MNYSKLTLYFSFIVVKISAPALTYCYFIQC
jgi:hypothetical protein